MRSDCVPRLVCMSELRVALTRMFGFDDFRPGQEAVVRAAVEGRDTLALMPTGSGKSLTYQLAAMLRPTPTLVLSPLIALMKDQVDKLPPEVAAQSTLINSSLDPDEAAARLRGVSEGRYRMLYVAPERLRSRNFLDAISRIDVGLVVIDEVHCVSMWGHDFRPDYLFIRRALDALGNAGDPRDDCDRDAGDGTGDRSRPRPRAGDRPHERRPAQPPLRRRDRRRRGGAAADARPPAARAARRVARSSTRAPVAAARASRARCVPTTWRPSTTTPGSSRPSAPPLRRPSSKAGSRRSSQRPPSGWGSTSRTSGSWRSTTTPSRSRATCRWSDAQAGTAVPRTRSCSRAGRMRSSCAGSRARTSPRSTTSARSTRGSAAARRCRRRSSATSPIRACSWECSSRSGWCAAASTPAGRCRSRCRTHRPTPRARIDALLARYEREALARTDRLVRFAESRGCRHRAGRRALRGDARRRTAACATSARRSRSGRRAGSTLRRCPTTSPEPFIAPPSTFAGRSGAPVWRRCSAAR